jgi:HEAT repeat protein
MGANDRREPPVTPGAVAQPEMAHLLAAFASGDDRQVEAAARLVAERGAPALPAVVALLAAPDPEQRWWAVRILGEIGEPQVGAHLTRALHDPERSVRHCAALALRAQPWPPAIPDLLVLLGDEDRLLARLAGDALAAAGQAGTPGLLAVLQDGRQPARLEAVRALALLGDTSAIPALFAALDDESALIEYWANEGLERMGVGMAFFKP